MTRAATVERARAYFDDAAGYFADLTRRVAIPTECQEPERLPELYRYLSEAMGPAFEAMGFEGTVYDNPLDGLAPWRLTREGDRRPQEPS